MKRNLLFALLLLLAPTLFADRPRPIVAKGTFLTDKGDLIRGLRHSVDTDGLPPGCALGAANCALVDNVRTLGMNAIHIYAEKYGQPVGSNLAMVRQLVDWAGNAGLYAVIVIGGQDCKIDYTKAFWDLYAKEFGARTQVLFEIKNEVVGSWDPPSDQCARNVNSEGYKAIRVWAKDTPVMLFSYPFFEDSPGIIEDIRVLSAFVDWSKTGVAFHGYQTACGAAFNCDDPSITNATIDQVQLAYPNVPLMNTEFFVVTDTSTNPVTIKQAKTQVYEDQRVSWLSFISLHYASLYPANVKAPIDAEEVVWTNEFGLAWPAVNTPPVGSNISLRAKNGMYVTVNATTRRMRANTPTVNISEKFNVKRVATGSPYVCLQSLLTSQYAWANPGNANKLEASAAGCATGKFEWMKRPNGAVVLRSEHNGQTVDANLASDASLIAKRIDTPTGEATNFTVAIQP